MLIQEATGPSPKRKTISLRDTAGLQVDIVNLQELSESNLGGKSHRTSCCHYISNVSELSPGAGIWKNLCLYAANMLEHPVDGIRPFPARKGSAGLDPCLSERII